MAKAGSSQPITASRSNGPSTTNAARRPCTCSSPITGFSPGRPRYFGRGRRSLMSPAAVLVGVAPAPPGVSSSTETGGCTSSSTVRPMHQMGRPCRSSGMTRRSSKNSRCAGRLSSAAGRSSTSPSWTATGRSSADLVSVLSQLSRE